MTRPRAKTRHPRKVPGHPDRACGAFDDLLLGHLELVLTMYLAGRDKDVNSMPLGAFDCGVDFFDVARIASGETADHGPEVFVGDGFYGLEVPRRCGRETRFYDVDIEFGECSGDTQLFPQRHAAARRLLPVA